jgi:hypothetical protein
VRVDAVIDVWLLLGLCKSLWYECHVGTKSLRIPLKQSWQTSSGTPSASSHKWKHVPIMPFKLFPVPLVVESTCRFLSAALKSSPVTRQPLRWHHCWESILTHIQTPILCSAYRLVSTGLASHTHSSVVVCPFIMTSGAATFPLKCTKSAITSTSPMLGKEFSPMVTKRVSWDLATAWMIRRCATMRLICTNWAGCVMSQSLVQHPLGPTLWWDTPTTRAVYKQFV